MKLVTNWPRMRLILDYSFTRTDQGKNENLGISFFPCKISITDHLFCNKKILMFKKILLSFYLTEELLYNSDNSY